MKRSRSFLLLKVAQSILGISSVVAGEPVIPDALRSRDPAERERAMRGLSEQLSRLDREGDRPELERLLAGLRRAAEGGDLETRSRIGELLAPFEAGGALWHCGDLPGIVCAIEPEGARLRIAVNGKPSRAGMIDLATGKTEWRQAPLTWGMGAAAFSGDSVVAGGYLQTDPDKLKGWMMVLDGAGEGENVIWTRTADEMPGVRSLDLLPEGILAGGAAAVYQGKIETNGRVAEGYDPEGWVGLFDPATGKPVWIRKPGELAANNVSILPVPGGALVAGLDIKGKAAWVHRYDLATGKLDWIFVKDLPPKATALDPAGPGRVCLRQAAGWIGLLDIGYDGSKNPEFLWTQDVAGSVRATVTGKAAVFVAGHEHGRGFLSAHDIGTGKESWIVRDFPGNPWTVSTGEGVVCVAGGEQGRGWISVHDVGTGQVLWKAGTGQPVQHLRILRDRLVTAGGRGIDCWRLRGGGAVLIR